MTNTGVNFDEMITDLNAGVNGTYGQTHIHARADKGDGEREGLQTIMHCMKTKAIAIAARYPKEIPTRISPTRMWS